MNVLYGLLIIVGLSLFFVFVRPRNMKIYDEIKLALLLAGLAYRDDKVKKITAILLDIVKQLEYLQTTNDEKCAMAIQMASVEILKKLGITMDEDLLETLVNVTVSYIPPTHQ